MVGEAGIELATTGLEILRAYSLSPLSISVFSIFLFPFVHSESFGDDLLRGVGQSSGMIQHGAPPCFSVSER